MSSADVRAVQVAYPQIYLACHRRHERAPRSEFGISDHDANLLGHLDRSTPTSPLSLARHMGVAASTMSEAIDRLADLGLLSRRRRDDDKRRVDLFLTQKGERALRATSILEEERVGRLLAKLGPRQRKIAIEGIGALARAARELMNDKGNRPRKATTKERRQP